MKHLQIAESYVKEDIDMNILTKIHINMRNIKVVCDIPQTCQFAEGPI